MVHALLLCAALCGQGQGPKVGVLVAQLGATRYQEREDAADALERLGKSALPALIAAKGHDDPEVRLRVAGLISKIEGNLLTQASLLTLNFDDQPLSAVVKALTEQSGVRLTLVPEAAPNWGTRRVTLREDAPLPFWKALDRLCEAGRLQYNVGMSAFPPGRDRGFPLFDGMMTTTAPVSDSGPFRITLTGLHYQRDISFPNVARTATPGANPTDPTLPNVTEQFHAQLQVLSEPRLSIAQSGQVRVIEATDDRNQSLVGPSAAGAIAQRASGYSGMGAGPALMLQATLNRPAVPGRTIRRLRGVVPVIASTRKPEPLSLKLTDKANWSVKNEDAEIVVHDVKVQENSLQTQIVLSVRGLSDKPDAALAEPGLRTANSHQQQIEVVDARGRVLAWYQTGYDAQSERVTMTLIPQGGDPANAPTEVRYYELVRAPADVAFDFHDLPMP